MKGSRHLCPTPRCRNKKAPSSNYCHACKKRQYRARNRMRDSWQHLKDNSKRRGIFFDLTFEEFAHFCYETDYLYGVGKKKTSFSVDRIIEEIGYTAGNLQVLTLSNNSKKENARRKTLVYDYVTKFATVVKSTITPLKDWYEIEGIQ
jgi:hypothetical protein